MSNLIIGANSASTSMADVIQTACNISSTGRVPSYLNTVHQTFQLNHFIEQEMLNINNTNFAAGLRSGKMLHQNIDSIWCNPFNCTISPTVPMPMTLVTAPKRMLQTQFDHEFQFTKTQDYLNQCVLRLILPPLDASRISSCPNNLGVDDRSTPDMYLLAWHHDLVPRIINTIRLYSRQSTHRIMEYTGKDIWIHNMLFGAENREINDLMAGEDKFELTYDPYRVDSSAMGAVPYRGVNEFTKYVTTATGHQQIWAVKPTADNSTTQEGFIQFYERMDDIDSVTFRNTYVTNRWHEAPVAVSYDPRRPLQSRAKYHESRVILIPLTILPIGSSIEASITTGALTGDCGYISVSIYDNWVKRAIYATNLKDIQPPDFLPNHQHYEEGDMGADGNPIAADDERLGWVNPDSKSRQSYSRKGLGGEGEPKTRDVDDFSRGPNSYVGFGGMDLLANHIPVNAYPTNVTDTITDDKNWIYKENRLNPGANFTLTKGYRLRDPETGLTMKSIDDIDVVNKFISSLDEIKQNGMRSNAALTYYNELTAQLEVQMIQVCFMSLPILREAMIRLPRILITLEYKDNQMNLNTDKMDIPTDIYITGIAMTVCPIDTNGVESYRVFPPDMVKYTEPLISGVRVCTEQNQGYTTYSWDMLNLFHPSFMGIKPLMSNVGLITFSPNLPSNQNPYAFYDPTILGKITLEIVDKNGSSLDMNKVNIKTGSILVTTIGINGLVLAKMSMFKMVF